MATMNLEGVTKIYPNGKPAVQDLDLDVADGEFMVLVGPSGCGKTSIFVWSPASKRSATGSC